MHRECQLEILQQAMSCLAPNPNLFQSWHTLRLVAQP